MENTKEMFVKISASTDKFLNALEKVKTCVKELDKAIEEFNNTAIEVKSESQVRDKNA